MHRKRFAVKELYIQPLDYSFISNSPYDQSYSNKVISKDVYPKFVYLRYKTSYY